MIKIKHVILISTALTALFSAGFYMFGTLAQAVNCILGGFIVAVNFVLIIWSIRRIFLKKSVALASTVIVSKYAALIGLFVLLNSIGWQVDIGLFVGLCTILPAVVIAATRSLNFGEDNGSL